MLRVGTRDRPADGTTLSLLEAAILDFIFKAFVRGLSDDEILKNVIHGFIGIGRSLRRLCFLTKKTEKSKPNSANTWTTIFVLKN